MKKFSRGASTCLLLLGFVVAAWLRFDVGSAVGSWSVALITFGATAWSWIYQARRLPPVEFSPVLQELGNRESLDPEEEARFAEGLRAWHAQQQRDAWREIERGGPGPLIAARAVLYFLWSVPFTIVLVPPSALPGAFLPGLPRFLVVLLPLAMASVAVAAPLGIRDWSRARDALATEESRPFRKMTEVFEAIQQSFPHLAMTIATDDPQLDVNVTIERQPGLAFDVNLNQQGDELHLDAGTFWLEWFPSTDPKVVEHYLDAVGGLLSGRYRIVEQKIGRIAVRAELQRPHADGWEMIGGTGHWGAIIPWPRTSTVLRNAQR